jgi:hypothetical protein
MAFELLPLRRLELVVEISEEMVCVAHDDVVLSMAFVSSVSHF